MTFGKEKTQTTTTSPYGPAEGSIGKIIEGADNWFESGGNKQAPMNAYTRQALNQTRQLAGQGVQGLNEANTYNTGLIANGGWTDETRQAFDYLNPFASGQYQEDPRLQKQLDINADRALNGAATMFGGGRYGSAGIGQGVGNAVADANNGVMLQSNENARNRQLQATGMMGDMSAGARSAALQGSSMLPMLDNLKYSGAERLAGVGDYYQQRAQDRRNLPFENLQGYSGIIGSMGGMGGSVTKPKAGSSAQSAIGGALSGAKIGNDILPGGWGAILTGAGGGLLGGSSW